MSRSEPVSMPRRKAAEDPHAQVQRAMDFADSGDFVRARKALSEVSVRGLRDAANALAQRALLAQGSEQKALLRFMVDVARPMPIEARFSLCEGLGITALERGSEALWNALMQFYPRIKRPSDIFSSLSSRGIDIAATVMRGLDLELSSHNRWVAESKLSSKFEAVTETFGTRQAQRLEQLPEAGVTAYTAAALPWAQRAYNDLRSKGVYPLVDLLHSWVEREQFELIAELVDKTQLKMYSLPQKLEFALTLAGKTESLVRWQRQNQASVIWRQTWWPRFIPLLPLALVKPEDLPPLTAAGWQTEPGRPGQVRAQLAHGGVLFGKKTATGVEVEIAYQIAHALSDDYQGRSREQIAQTLYTDAQKWHLERAVRVPAPTSSSTRRRI